MILPLPQRLQDLYAAAAKAAEQFGTLLLKGSILPLSSPTSQLRGCLILAALSSRFHRELATTGAHQRRHLPLQLQAATEFTIVTSAAATYRRASCQLS